MSGKVVLIGAGPGEWGLLTLKGAEILKKAGYKKGLGFVPLSNGEQIIEPPVFGIAWNELCKQASQKGNSEPTTSDQVR